VSWGAKKNTKKGVMVNNEKYVVKETLEDVLKYPFADIPERGIRKAILEKFGVRMSVSQTDVKTPTAVYFPNYDQKDKLTGFKKRDLTVPKEHDFHFTVVGRVAIDSKFFGQHEIEKIPRKRNKLVIEEGEWDFLSYYQAAVDSVKGTQYEGIEPFVVSLTLGTGNAVDCVLSNKSFVDDFTNVVLSFDNDEANAVERKKKVMKGKEATVAVAAALMSDKVLTACKPDPYKDANEMLLAGKGKELVKCVNFDAKKFVGEKIVSTSSISLDDLMEDRVEGVYVNTFPKLMQKIHGFRGNELVVLTAPSNVGKSYVLSEFAYNFLEAGESLGFMMLEETKKETTQRMLARKLKVNYNVFKDKPTSVASPDQIREAKRWLDEDCSCFMLDHFGSIPINELMNKVKNFVFIHKCRFILLDHLSIVISGNQVADERKELDMVMTELATFCAANDVCIIAVAHINRSNSGEFKAPKGKEDEPFWVTVTKEQMRGSAALEQLSWIVLGLEPQIMPDRSRGHVRLTVLKNRPWSYLGVADEFSMNEQTGLLECVSNSF
jgi:archaellum biogenesis ATPase FlaH